MRHCTAKLIVGMACLALMVTSTTVFAHDKKEYAVTITNLTRGQSFTPILVVNHHHGLTLFTVGSPASEELAALDTEKCVIGGNEHARKRNPAKLFPGFHCHGCAVPWTK